MGGAPQLRTSIYASAHKCATKCARFYGITITYFSKMRTCVAKVQNFVYREKPTTSYTNRKLFDFCYASAQPCKKHDYKAVKPCALSADHVRTMCASAQRSTQRRGNAPPHSIPPPHVMHCKELRLIMLWRLARISPKKTSMQHAGNNVSLRMT